MAGTFGGMRAYSPKLAAQIGRLRDFGDFIVAGVSGSLTTDASGIASISLSGYWTPTGAIVNAVNSVTGAAASHIVSLDVIPTTSKLLVKVRLLNGTQLNAGVTQIAYLAWRT